MSVFVKRKKKKRETMKETTITLNTNPAQPLLRSSRKTSNKKKLISILLLTVGCLGMLSITIALLAVQTLVFDKQRISILENFVVDTKHEERPKAWTEAMEKANIRTHDGAFSIATDAESALWFFRDTTLSKNQELYGEVLINNALLRVSLKNETVVDAKYYLSDNRGAKQIIINEKNEPHSHFRVWPVAGVLLNNEVHVFYKIYRIGWRELFKVGRGILHENGTFTRISSDEVFCPVSAITDADGEKVYFFIMKEMDILLARENVDAMKDATSEYEYYKEGEWVKELNEATPITTLTEGEVVSVSYNSFLEEYMMLIIEGQNLKIRTSKKIEGVWSDEVEVYTLDTETFGKEAYIQSAYFLPELFGEGGRIIKVAFNIGGPSTSDLRPHIISIELNKK